MALIPRLLDDHASFRTLGRALETQVRSDAPDPAEVRRLTQDFRKLFDAHGRLEDDTLYPAIRGALNGAEGRLNDAYMNHLDNEHHRLDGYLAQLEGQVAGPFPEPGWGQTFALFSIGLRTHLRKEEEELFPAAERLLGAERLASLG